MGGTIQWKDKGSMGLARPADERLARKVKPCGQAVETTLGIVPDKTGR